LRFFQFFFFRVLSFALFESVVCCAEHHDSSAFSASSHGCSVHEGIPRLPFLWRLFSVCVECKKI
jgi:hypothetical protein